MALVLAIDKISQSLDASSLIIDDTTGSSTGGWGNSGNPDYTAITSAIVRVYLPHNSTPVIFPLDATQAQVLANPAGVGTLELTAINLGLDTELSPLPNGVYTLEYFTFMQTLSVGATNCDRTITGTGFLTAFADTDVIAIDGVIYFIDKSTGFTNTTLELTSDYEGTTGTKTAYVVYMATKDILVDQDAVNRVQCSLSKIDECDCNEKAMEYFMFYTLLMGARAKEACEDFQGAQVIMDVLVSDLDTHGPCGC